MMCGLAGALYVPQVGIINPGEMSPAASIEIAIWTAVGGRATLVGPIIGAFAYAGLHEQLMKVTMYWRFALGLSIVPPMRPIPRAVRSRGKPWA